MSTKKELCAYCGTQVPSGALYCPHCGEPTDTSSEYDEEISSEGAFFGEEKETGKGEEITSVPIISSTPSERGTRVLYKGMIRGSVASESTLKLSPEGRSVNLREVYFVMKLEEKIGIEGIPEEILVLTRNFGYFGIGDRVILQGKILKTVLKKWERPMYTILAYDFYNESLQIGDEKLMRGKQVLYEGTIRGLVTKGSIINVSGHLRFFVTYFAIKLEENIGIPGLPDEILVRYDSQGYFRTGDRVILQGKILKTVLKKWERPMYAIQAGRFYNETLQVGNRF
ncbi:MAG: zinc ribbon domain-containing protein [Candidatus Freyarchaeum deiterrae]